MSYFLINSNIFVIPGWVKEPQGCGLIEIPGDLNVHGLPSLPFNALISYPPPWAWKKPLGDSKILSVEDHPYLTKSQAITPLSAALPACSGFVIVPKFSLNPALREAAIPKDLKILLWSYFLILAAAEAEAKVPQVAVEWKPCW